MRNLKKDFIPHRGNDYRPHFLRHQSVLIFFLLIIIAELVFLVQVFIVFDKTKFLATVLPAVLTSLTNEERAKNDAPPLVVNDLLTQAAQLKAEDMAVKSYFAHTSPEGKTPWYWFDQVGYKYMYAGENLAVNFFESEDLSEAWMNSPTHRANVIKKDYTEIGIGIAKGKYESRNTVFVVELFGKPALAAAPEVTTPVPVYVPEKIPVKTPAPTPAPTPKPEPTPTPTPEPTPEPELVPQIAVAPPETTTVTPTETQILGEEVNSTNVATGGMSKVSSSLKSAIRKILSSPRESVGYFYGSIALLVLLTLFVVFVKSEIKHPVVIARGFAVIAVILIFSYINLRVFNVETQVPESGPNTNLNASVIEALPH